MSYRKFRGDHLFTGHQMLGNDYVLITNKEGRVETIEHIDSAGDDIYTASGILAPGFVNCHCHLELSHMKGVIPEKTGMVDFLLSVLGKRSYPRELVQDEIQSAEQSMLDFGIVAVGDICNTNDTLERKKRSRLYYHNFIESTGFVPATAEQRFQASKFIFDQFAALNHLPFPSNSIVPHAPYSVSPELFQRISHFPGNHLITVHNQESQAEDEFFKKGTGDMLRLYQSLGIDISFFKPSGKSSLQTIIPWLLPNRKMILVHNVTTSKEDLEVIAQFREHHSSLPAFSYPILIFCLCPNANLYIGNGLPDIDLLRQHDEMIVIGTDSLASNHILSIASELSTIRKHFPHIETAELLRWATSNGANALGLDNVLGSFEKGKQPGVIVINEDFSEVKRVL
jgi:cytosine/adenosine deaminase-related metal-dependent hydrolase